LVLARILTSISTNSAPFPTILKKVDLEVACSLKDFLPGYMQVEEIKKAAEKIGVKKGIKKGKKEGKIEMAKNWKENGVDISLIAISSELSKEEIEKLYTYKFPDIKTPSPSFH